MNWKLDSLSAAAFYRDFGARAEAFSVFRTILGSSPSSFQEAPNQVGSSQASGIRGSETWTVNLDSGRLEISVSAIKLGAFNAVSFVDEESAFKQVEGLIPQLTEIAASLGDLYRFAVIAQFAIPCQSHEAATFALLSEVGGLLPMIHQSDLDLTFQVNRRKHIGSGRVYANRIYGCGVGFAQTSQINLQMGSQSVAPTTEFAALQKFDINTVIDDPSFHSGNLEGAFVACFEETRRFREYGYVYL